MDGDGKLFPAPQASKEVAGLAFKKPAEKVIYWSIQRFQTKLLPRRNEQCIPCCHTTPCPNDILEKQEEEGMPCLDMAS